MLLGAVLGSQSRHRYAQGRWEYALKHTLTMLLHRYFLGLLVSASLLQIGKGRIL